MKTTKRTIELFTADCPLCHDAVTKVQALACPSCDVAVYDLREAARQPNGMAKARAYGVTTVPAVAVNGRLLDCCKGERLMPEILRAAGVGTP